MSKILRNIELNGNYGKFGGRYVPPVLEKRLTDLNNSFEKLKTNTNFLKELSYYQTNYIGRPSPLYYAQNLSNKIGAKIYLKREDLNHTGSHKINNTIGQILVAKFLGFKEIIAETGAGQHGIATATVAALFGMNCKIFMGAEDARRQHINALKIKALGAELIEVTNGTSTLKDAVDSALEYYIKNENSFYLLGSAVGPNPYPKMVAFFQSIIGREAKKQIINIENRLPDMVFACIGGGSNAIGMFYEFLDDMEVQLFAAEGGGFSDKPGETAASLSLGKPIVFHGMYSYCLVDNKNKQIDAYSISAGLDYPGIGPYHSYLKDTGRVRYTPVYDKEALDGFQLLMRTEGIVPALESSHAIGLLMKIAKNTNKLCILNLSGRGDKDLNTIM